MSTHFQALNNKDHSCRVDLGNSRLWGTSIQLSFPEQGFDENECLPPSGHVILNPQEFKKMVDKFLKGRVLCLGDRNFFKRAVVEVLKQEWEEIYLWWS